MYKVLICGNTDWAKEAPIRALLKRLRTKHGTSKLLIIEGGADGADQMAGRIARELNIHVVEVQALWDTRHRSAGPQRNAVMMSLGPDEVHAFHREGDADSGTGNMISKARKRGVPTTEHHR
jgi:hypothetical protein